MSTRLTHTSDDTQVSVCQYQTFLAVMGTIFQGLHLEEITPMLHAATLKGIGHLPTLAKPPEPSDKSLKGKNQPKAKPANDPKTGKDLDVNDPCLVWNF